MAEKVRIVHSRFYQGNPVRKSQPYDKIVTSCWSYNRDTHILSYGATVYTKSEKSAWYKTEHKYTAIERYEKQPVKLVMLSDLHLRNVAIDWHIACEYIFKFGCFAKTGSVCIDRDYNTQYSYLKPETVEKKYTLTEATEKFRKSVV